MTSGPDRLTAISAHRPDTAIAADLSDDATLVQRAIEGDRGAFEVLVADRLDRAFRTALAIVGREADASDAVQETFIATWQQLPKLRDPDRFDAWVARVLVNQCRMTLRRRGRIREIRMPDEPIGHRQLTTDQASLAEVDAVDRAFDRLSVDDRALLVLHHLDERPIRDISTAMGIPEGTVKWRLFRARRALEKGLEAENR